MSTFKYFYITESVIQMLEILFWAFTDKVIWKHLMGLNGIGGVLHEEQVYLWLYCFQMIALYHGYYKPGAGPWYLVDQTQLMP